jgi:hypothetical protein
MQSHYDTATDSSNKMACTTERVGGKVCSNDARTVTDIAFSQSFSHIATLTCSGRHFFLLSPTSVSSDILTSWERSEFIEPPLVYTLTILAACHSLHVPQKSLFSDQCKLVLRVSANEITTGLSIDDSESMARSKHIGVPHNMRTLK